MRAVIYVICLLVALGVANEIPLFGCGTLGEHNATYKLVKDIVVESPASNFICFDITGHHITLEGSGFEISTTAIMKDVPTTGVRYIDVHNTVENLKIRNFATGIRATGKFGRIRNNSIAQAATGIDLSATHTNITDNLLHDFEGMESASAIYIYFPSVIPVPSYINVLDNKISHITGSSFALGISVHSATHIKITHNTIEHLGGGLVSDDILISNGEADIKSNVIDWGVYKASRSGSVIKDTTETSVKSSLAFPLDTTGAIILVLCLAFGLYFIPFGRKKSTPAPRTTRARKPTKAN